MTQQQSEPFNPDDPRSPVPLKHHRDSLTWPNNDDTIYDTNADSTS